MPNRKIFMCSICVQTFKSFSRFRKHGQRKHEGRVLGQEIEVRGG